MRLGKKKAPQYRIVVVDGRARRDGRVIETIGQYRPKQEPSFMQVDPERAGYWLGVGAQPTESVRAILKVTGDWQRFRGEPAPEPMRTAQERPDKKALFDAAAKEAAGEPDAAATTPKRRTAKKAAAKKAAEPDQATASESAAEPSEDGEQSAGPAGENAAESGESAEQPSGEQPSADQP
jgi:small subunit ribosomal protein S16